MRWATTAASTRSDRCFGNTLPRLGSPTWCPARPMRWSPRDTDPGDSTWITRSTAPMSIPSSREDVATRPLSRPAFRSSSMISRRSFDSDPWCAFTSSTSTGGTPTASDPANRGESPGASAAPSRSAAP